MYYLSCQCELLCKNSLDATKTVASSIGVRWVSQAQHSFLGAFSQVPFFGIVPCSSVWNTVFERKLTNVFSEWQEIETGQTISQERTNGSSRHGISHFCFFVDCIGDVQVIVGLHWVVSWDLYCALDLQCGCVDGAIKIYLHICSLQIPSLALFVYIIVWNMIKKGFVLGTLIQFLRSVCGPVSICVGVDFSSMYIQIHWGCSRTLVLGLLLCVFATGLAMCCGTQPPPSPPCGKWHDSSRPWAPMGLLSPSADVLECRWHSH